MSVPRTEPATRGSALAELLFRLYHGPVHRTLRWEDLDDRSRTAWELDADAIRGYLLHAEGWQGPR